MAPPMRLTKRQSRELINCRLGLAFALLRLMQARDKKITGRLMKMTET